MKTNALIGWLLAVLVAVGLAWWALGDRAPQRDVANQGLLLPDLAARLNEIDSVQVIGGGNSVLATIERQSDGWGLVERNGYPVDSGKLRSLLLALTQARRIEAKTANPELYERLAVEDVTAAGAKGVALLIEGGGPPTRLIVGQNNPRGSGTYVRVEGEATSWLVDRNIAVERQPVEWLQRELVNVAAARVQTVEVVPPAGEPIRIARDEGAAGDFRIENLPRGREPQSEFVADATAGLLDALRFEDVVAAAEQPEPETGVRTARFLTGDGLRVDLRSWQEDGKTFASFSAERVASTVEPADAPDAPDVVTTDARSSPQETAVDVAAGEPAIAAGSPADAAAPEVDVAQELAALQQRFADRVFVLPAYKSGSLNRDLDAYLKPKE